MKLVWSHLAVEELRDLRRYSIERWGAAVATRYMADVRAAAHQIAARPDLARELKGRFRIVRVRSHYLIVHADDTTDRLTIARVLHVAMNIERHLPRDD